uniref:uncharacterized protein LOC120328046 n=1 Tax=Styela clava TaxID=7725 RepID=UPI00193950A3|nr:uncharacterized protein LOC120328046 [Styela clava]
MNLKRRTKGILLAFPAVVILILLQRKKHSTTFQYDVKTNKISPTVKIKQTKFVHDISTTTHAYDWNAAPQRFSKRKLHLDNACKRRLNKPLRLKWKKNQAFIANYERRMLVCASHKAGSSTWHWMIWATNIKQKGLDPYKESYGRDAALGNYKIVGKLSETQGNKLITHVKGDDNFFNPSPKNSSFRIILTRHPFGRLISAWNQKFLKTSNYWTTLLKTYKVMLNYKKDIVKDHAMSFKDLATYIANIHGNGRYFDMHFHPISKICELCEYDYTYILKAESVDQDEPWLMKRLNLTDVTIRKRNMAIGGSLINNNPKVNIKKYMSMLPPTVVQKLYKLYEADFDYFGYTFNLTTLEAGGFE